MSLSILELQEDEREFARIMLVNRMRFFNVSLDVPWPVETLATADQATALLDLLYDKIPKGRLCVIIKDLPSNTGLQAVESLGREINFGRGFVEAKPSGEIAVIMFGWDSNERKILCRFGYTADGLRISRNITTQGIEILVSIPTNLIVDQSLYKLYLLTKNINYIYILGTKQQIIARGESRITTSSIDPRQYYAILGLNPNVAQLMSKETLSSMIKAIKRGLAKQLHEDVTHTRSAFQEEYLKSALEAASFLEDDRQRDEYTNWQ